jgi:GDP-4-dehydro-6-deoxy-D-mannose reductase
MKKVLIFGIGGFVGPYLAQEFLDEGYSVYGSDLVKGDRLQTAVGFFQANLLNAEDVCTIIHQLQPDIIINLAAVSSVGQSWKIPQQTIEVNIVGTLNILEAVKSMERMSKVLLIGSSEEYDISDKPINESTVLKANNPYGISKVAQERFANLYKVQYGMQIYYVRAFNHTGVGQKDSFVLPSFCKQAAEIERSGKPGIIKVGNLLARRDFGHVKDLMRAYRLIVESPYCDTIYNVGSGKAHSLREMLNYIISLCTQSIKIEVDPDRVRPIDNPVICCDNAKIKAELGWEPRYNVFDALKEMFDYYLHS